MDQYRPSRPCFLLSKTVLFRRKKGRPLYDLRKTRGQEISYLLLAKHYRSVLVSSNITIFFVVLGKGLADYGC